MNLTERELLFIIIILLLINLFLLFFVLLFVSKSKQLSQYTKEIVDDAKKEIQTNVELLSSANQSLLTEKLNHLSSSLKESIKILSDYMFKSFKQTSNESNQQLSIINQTLHNSSLVQENKLEAIRQTVDNNLAALRQDNNSKLEQMRLTVDEKLNETLENRITQSFQIVSQQLEAVHKGLGEMQSLAVGVGDLKKILSNVKNRGILGEIQLEAILRDILSENQFVQNINTIPNSSERVEFAIKLPAEESFIYLPIDSKFPADTYLSLQEALDLGKKEEIEYARKNLFNTLRKEAKDIKDKYVLPPYTTDFGVMFLPTESLYCEAINLGLLEILQRDFKITICGPSTMAALLNSLQMGFKTLAIQKRSSEVWNLLGSVKNEFEKFEGALTAAQNRIQQTSDELDKLVGVRTRAINKQLRNVQTNHLSLEEYDRMNIEIKDGK